MASKKDLEARIEALEAEIAQLRLQSAQRVVVLPQPMYPYYYGYYGRLPGQVWFSTTSNSIAVDRDATPDEFRAAYAQEKPRWSELADRLS